MKRIGLGGHHQSSKARRPELSHEHIAELVNVALVIPIVVALPLLDFIGPPCVRFLQRRRNPERSGKATFPAGSAGTLAE
jgi:hypothetical protein